MLLVIGATGELGSKIVRNLRVGGADVRVLARPGSAVEDLLALGVDVVRGDLTDLASLDEVCVGVETVVATASTIVPRRGERTTCRALTEGYRRLAEKAEDAGVRRFVFVSVPTDLMGRGAAEFDQKAKVESALGGRRFELCVVRPSLFMQSWLPAVGSRLAVSGASRATLDRGFWLSRFAGAVLHRSIDRWGIAQVPGRRDVRHSFVDVDDVAAIVTNIALAAGSVPGEVELGGPAALTWREVAELHGRALERQIRCVRIPSGPFAVLSRALRPISPTAGHLLAVQALVGRRSTSIDSAAAEAYLGRPPTSVSSLLARSRA